MTDPLVPMRQSADPVGRLLARAAPSMKTPSLAPEARARILGALPQEPPPPLSSTPSWLKALGIAGVGAALVAGVVMRRSPPAPVVAPVIEPAPVVAPVGPAPEEAPVAAPVFSVHDLPTAPPVVVPPAPEVDTLAREVALLDRARASSDPLPLLDEHARTFPHGSLGPEREVFAVEALLRAGRRADAEARGAAFVRSHAGTPHAMRIERLLQPDQVQP